VLLQGSSLGEALLAAHSEAGKVSPAGLLKNVQETEQRFSGAVKAWNYSKETGG
jgi:hypothetical protein